MNSPYIDTTPVIDVCALPCAVRKAVIFETFDALLPGQSFEIVNDHDPVPLRRAFAARTVAAFQWHYMENGPQFWRVRITRS